MSQSHEQTKHLDPNMQPDRQSRRRGIEHYLMLGAMVLLPAMAQALPSDRQTGLSRSSPTRQISITRKASPFIRAMSL